MAIFTYFNISIFSGQKHTAGDILFLNANAFLLKCKILHKLFNINIFGG
jgi:hypothetical protein